MNDMTITQEQVNAAADAICAEGNKPTVLDVRKRLQTGSISAVWRLFQVWQSAQVLPAEQDVSVPSELLRPLEEFITRQVAAVKSQFENEIETLRQINSELMAEIDKQEQQLTLQGVELNSARAIKNEVSGRFEQLNSELKRAKEETDDTGALPVERAHVEALAGGDREGVHRQRNRGEEQFYECHFHYFLIK